MSNHAIIDLPALIQIIQREYALSVVDLHFLQRGWGGDCYRAETQNGASYFLKLNDAAASYETAASSRTFYLPLMHQLHAKNILPHIPHPILTRTGAYSLNLNPQELVITKWIEGKLVGFGKLPEPILARLAETVGILHRSRPQLEFEHPFIEQFEFPYATDLIHSRSILEAVSSLDRLGKQSLRQVLMPRWEELLAYLTRMQQLQETVRSLPKPMVICHTDLHGANLMTDDQDTLYLLDWETALIAPLEHDMIFFAGEENFWDVFWPNYTRQFPEAGLDREMLAFYFYRRGLEDVVGFILRILQGDGSEERDQEDIDWLRGCLDGLGQIEIKIEKIQAQLNLLSRVKARSGDNE